MLFEHVTQDCEQQLTDLAIERESTIRYPAWELVAIEETLDHVRPVCLRVKRRNPVGIAETARSGRSDSGLAARQRTR